MPLNVNNGSLIGIKASGRMEQREDDMSRKTPASSQSTAMGQGGRVTPQPTPAQRRYLERGLMQPGGKLPIFDEEGQQIDPRTVRACLKQGWAESWVGNPIKPDWLVCRLTDAGRHAVTEK